MRICTGNGASQLVDMVSLRRVRSVPFVSARSGGRGEMRAADDPFGHSDVDHPPRGGSDELARVVDAEQGFADAFGDRLSAGADGECVGADHPGAVCGDVAAADGGEPEDEAGCGR